MTDALHFVGLVCAIALIVYGVLVVGEKFDD